MYELHYEIDVAKACKRFPKRDKEAIILALEKLKENPRPEGAIKLTNHQEAYRMRVGNYRIVYHIQDKQLIVLIIDIDNRASIYKKK